MISSLNFWPNLTPSIVQSKLLNPIVYMYIYSYTVSVNVKRLYKYKIYTIRLYK